MNMSRIFLLLLLQSLREVEIGFTSRNGDYNENVVTHVHFRADVTLGNDSSNLCHNDETKLRDKLQENCLV